MITEKSIEELMINAKELDFAKSYHEKQTKIVEVVNREYGESLVASNGEIYIVISKEDHPVFGVGYISLSRSYPVDNRLCECLCTIEEYNQCIEEMKYHYDIPKWCSYNRADKEPLTVENSNYSFYEKEKFVYGQDVYVNHGEWKDRLMKFGCFTLDSKKALLFDGDGYCRVTVESISSKPIKSKEDVELEEAKRNQVGYMASKYKGQYSCLSEAIYKFTEMQENGDLAEIKQTEEE